MSTRSFIALEEVERLVPQVRRCRAVELSAFNIEVECIGLVAINHLLIGGLMGRRRVADAGEIVVDSIAEGDDGVPVTGDEAVDLMSQLAIVGAYRVPVLPRGDTSGAIGGDGDECR